MERTGLSFLSVKFRLSNLLINVVLFVVIRYEWAKNILTRMVNANYFQAKDILHGPNLELENISQDNVVIQILIKWAV